MKPPKKRIHICINPGAKIITALNLCGRITPTEQTIVVHVLPRQELSSLEFDDIYIRANCVKCRRKFEKWQFSVKV